MVSLSLILIITASAVTPIKVGSNRLYVLCLILSLLLFNFTPSLELYNGYISLNPFRVYLMMLCYVVGLLSINSQIGSLLLLSLLGTSFLICSNHLSVMIVSLELQSFTGYGLAYLSRNTVSEDSVGSSLKYLLLGALASSFIMLGIGLVYVTSGILDNNTLLQLEWSSSLMASILLLVGILFKLGVAPFHQWVSDVYGNISNYTIGYLSLVPKIGALGLLTTLPLFDHSVLITVCIITMVVGSVGGLMQTEYRRLLAYSSVTHIGYLLLASNSHSVLLIYLTQYVVTTLGVLYCFQSLDTNNTGQLSSLSNKLHSQPYLSGLLGVLLFSLAGVPPFVGFFAKLEVFNELVSNDSILVLLVAITTSIIGAYYYLRVIMIMLNGNDDNNVNNNNSVMKYVLVLGILMVILGALEGKTFLQLAQLMAQHMVQDVSL